MKCPKCQFENPEGMIFCGRCATKIANSCPKCGFSNPPDFAFCGKCAFPLGESKEAPLVDYSEPQPHTSKFPANKALATRTSIEEETRIGPGSVRGHSKFVGRGPELQALKEFFEKTCSGSGQVVGIVGEAGVGKSRLLMEFRSMLPEGVYTYLEGRCLHYGGSMPYLPILDILRSYFGIEEGESEAIVKKKLEERILQLDEQLRYVLPPFHELLSLRVEDGEYLQLDPGVKKLRTFDAVQDLLVRGSEYKPLVLAVEDLHWIDKTSEEFLDYLVDRLAKAQILMILLYRPEYTHQWGSKSHYIQVGIDQLSTRNSGELVQAIFDGGLITQELSELILSRAGGNPLFVEELTQSLIENGSIKETKHGYVLSREVSKIEVPDTIQRIIASRIDRVEKNLRQIMEVVSVVGSEFAFRILRPVLQMKERLNAFAVTLEELAFIQERSFFPELEYIFKHNLIQEVTYNNLLLERRTSLHRKIGRAIEALYSERLEAYYEILAYHFSNSDDHQKAYQYLKLSGMKAARNYSLWESFHYLKEAIKVLERMPGREQRDQEHIEVRLLVSIPIVLLGYPGDSLAILQEGEKKSIEMKDEKSLLLFRSKLGHYYAMKGDPRQAIKYTKALYQKAQELRDIELIAPISCELCSSYFVAGHYFKILDVAPTVLAHLEQTQREHDFFGTRYSVHSGLCAHCVWALGMLGKFEEGKSFFGRGLRHAVELNNLYGLGFIQHCFGFMLLISGDWEKGVEHVAKGIECFEKAQASYLLGIAWALLGYGNSLSGEIETAQQCTEKGLQIHVDMGLSRWMSLQFWLMSMVYFEAKNLKKAQKTIEEAVRFSHKNNERDWQGITAIWQGRILRQEGTSKINIAEKCLLQGIKKLDELRLKPFSAQGHLFLGELYRDTNQSIKAKENADKAEEMFREMGMDYWVAAAMQIQRDL